MAAFVRRLGAVLAFGVGGAAPETQEVVITYPADGQSVASPLLFELVVVTDRALTKNLVFPLSHFRTQSMVKSDETVTFSFLTINHPRLPRDQNLRTLACEC